MTKETFMSHIAALYRAANMADQPERPDWMHPRMAGVAGCATLDYMLHAMMDCGVLTSEELQRFHDTL